MAANDEWEDVTAQHVGQPSDDWEDVTHQHLVGQTVYAQPIGPNPDLSLGSIKGAISDIIHQTPAGQRTFIPREQAKPVYGNPPMVLPVGGTAQTVLNGPNLLGKAASAINTVMGASAPARVAASTGVGALQDSEDRARGAVRGLATGLGSEALAKFFSGLSGAVSRPKEILDYAKDPAMAQDVASTALSDANEALTRDYHDRVGPLLEGKTYKIDPRAYQGTVPEADDAIREAMANKPYPDLPPEIEIPAKTGEKIRSSLDRSINYPKGTSVAIPKEVADRYMANKALADKIRAQRNVPGYEDLANLYDEWSTAIGRGSDLARKSGNPISAIASPSADNLALKLKVDRATGSDLTGLGDKFRSAEIVRKGDGFARPAWELGKQSVKGAYESGKSASGSPLEAFILSLMGKQPQK
jgi:hypothetical protein